KAPCTYGQGSLAKGSLYRVRTTNATYGAPTPNRSGWFSPFSGPRFAVLCRTEHRAIHTSDPGNVDPVHFRTKQDNSIDITRPTEQQHSTTRSLSELRTHNGVG
ncbi:unnamed protein product, partial [Laminaria digitata]